MLYWLIPYLVAFNATGSENWSHGPEYLFEGEIHRSVELENNVTTTGIVEVSFSCRPLNESSIRCRVESAEMTDSETDGNEPNQEKTEVKKDFNVPNWAFEVQFDRKGIHSIVFLNNEEENVRRDIIRSIFDPINIGSDHVSGLKIGRSLLSKEVSLLGVCDASARVAATPELPTAPGTPIGFYMDVPSFTERSENESLIISKDRYLDHCSVETPHFFSSHVHSDEKIKYNATMSETGIFFGRHRFGAGTANIGTFTMKRENPDHSGTTLSISGKTKETVHIALEAIRGATAKL